MRRTFTEHFAKHPCCDVTGLLRNTPKYGNLKSVLVTLAEQTRVNDIIVFKDHKESFVFTEYGRPDIKRL